MTDIADTTSAFMQNVWKRRLAGPNFLYKHAHVSFSSCRLSVTSRSSNPRSTVWRQSWKNSVRRNNEPLWKMSSCAWSSKRPAAATLNTRAYRPPSSRLKVRVTVNTLLQRDCYHQRKCKKKKKKSFSLVLSVQKGHKPPNSGTIS